MHTLKSKGKGQEAKGKSESTLRGCGQEGGERAPFAGTATMAQSARPWLPALLPFALCLLTFAFAFFLLPSELNAQGCAMCYTSASAARSTAKAALANGTLILLLPPMVFFALITVVVYRYRNKFREVSVVRGPLPVNPLIGRPGAQGTEVLGFGFWSTDRPIIRSPISLPRTTDDGPRTAGKQTQGAR